MVGSRSFAAILAARQAKVRVCGCRLALARASLKAGAGDNLGAASAAEFAAREAFRAGCRRALDEASAAFEAAQHECTGLEVLERREAAAGRRRRNRSEAREADERNRMLPTLRP
jgi:hypothetical protein